MAHVAEVAVADVGAAYVTEAGHFGVVPLWEQAEVVAGVVAAVAH